MRSAVYDNPATFMREYWEDGKCLEAMSYLIIDRMVEYPPERFPFYFNQGEFTPGQIIGNEKAIKYGE